MIVPITPPVRIRCDVSYVLTQLQPVSSIPVNVIVWLVQRNWPIASINWSITIHFNHNRQSEYKTTLFNYRLLIFTLGRRLQELKSWPLILIAQYHVCNMHNRRLDALFRVNFVRKRKKKIQFESGNAH